MYAIENKLTEQEEEELRRVALKKWNEGKSTSREVERFD